MQASRGLPHVLLFSESSWRGGEVGRWRFRIESVLSGRGFEAADHEPATNRDRLDLLAVVRGLEALNEPSRVTLVTVSRYVSRGLRHGVDEWREQNWCWERYGRRTAIRDDDLWRRVDGALQYHDVRCRLWNWAAPNSSLPPANEVEVRRANWWDWLVAAWRGERFVGRGLQDESVDCSQQIFA